jgi:hypothetical protein
VDRKAIRGSSASPDSDHTDEIVDAVGANRGNVVALPSAWTIRVFASAIAGTHVGAVETANSQARHARFTDAGLPVVPEHWRVA